VSKIIYVCSRKGPLGPTAEKRLRKIADALVPDNVKTKPESKVRVCGNTGYSVSMPNGQAHEDGMSVLLGCLFERGQFPWADIGQDRPDGNYALFRTTENEIEVATDAAGSRTIWYYFDDDLFIAATSQRAIVMFIGEFAFDDRVIRWMLSTGSLGPTLSWDRRIKRLQADSSVRLSRNDWTVSVEERPVVFSEVKRDSREHGEALVAATTKTIRSLAPLDFSRWVLTLSGGYDSRAVLYFIHKELGLPPGLRAVTWGVSDSVGAEGNDATIARQLALSLGLEHEYHQTDFLSEPVHVVVDRFLACGEGRIDKIPGYTDGLNMWAEFHRQGVVGIFRGDMGFSHKRFASVISGRPMLGCGFCSDFGNLGAIDHSLGICGGQELPEVLEKRKSESFDTWRDRLSHAYRLPSINAAASDIKYSYVEQINPLLSRAVLDVIRGLPDRLRNNKDVHKRIVSELGPKVRLGDGDATAPEADILRTQSFADFLKHEIRSDDTTDLLGYELMNRISMGLTTVPRRKLSWKRHIKRIGTIVIPEPLKSALRDRVSKPDIDPYVLAFRVIIIARMHKMLAADAQRLRTSAAG